MEEENGEGKVENGKWISSSILHLPSSILLLRVAGLTGSFKENFKLIALNSEPFCGKLECAHVPHLVVLT